VLGLQVKSNAPYTALKRWLTVVPPCASNRCGRTPRRCSWPNAFWRRFRVSEKLLYARVDLVDDGIGTAQLMEVELTEPQLFLALSVTTTTRLAHTIAARVAARRLSRRRA
jgi:hypothetical protein